METRRATYFWHHASGLQIEASVADFAKQVGMHENNAYVLLRRCGPGDRIQSSGHGWWCAGMSQRRTKFATFKSFLKMQVKGRTCVPYAAGEIGLGAAPHIVALALYQSGKGAKTCCDVLGISRRYTQALTKMLKGAGVFDSTRRFRGPRVGREKRLVHTTNTGAELDSEQRLERTHDRWWFDGMAPEENRRRKNRANHERMKRTPHLRAKFYLRKRLRNLVGRSRHRIKQDELVGCSPQELVAHLEKQFQPEMNWANHGPTWHIDHIIPCSHFDLTDREQVKRCFHFTNLRPLWGIVNRMKGDKILPEFAHLAA